MAGLWILESHKKACCDCMHVVQVAYLERRDGSGAEGSQ